MPLSILVDIKRNIAFAMHNRRMRRNDLRSRRRRAESATRVQDCYSGEVAKSTQRNSMSSWHNLIRTRPHASYEEEYEDDRLEKDEDLHTDEE